ncbi:MAG: hypothetical protein ABIQ27_01390 [Flavobacterium sp.]|uniref:hypothetical protein n=1 Tax=Flavobacterium sp. TaxID=239 RepID=UPI00326301AC
MSERKNIDRLFQEKFKDFEVNPPAETWGNIEAKLDGKKKRRVIPFWWKLSSVAAVFLVGFFISKSIYNPEINTENPVVNETNSNITNQADKENGSDKGLKTNQIKTGNPVVNENEDNKTKQTSIEDFNKRTIRNNSSIPVANKDDKEKSNIGSEENNKKTNSAFSSKSTVAERKSSNHRSLKNKSNSDKNKTSVAESIFEKSQNQVVQKISNNQSTAEKDIVQTDSKEEKIKKTQSASETTPLNLDNLKGNINSKIATKEIEKKVNDTAQKNSVANNVLEELLNEKESKLKQESKRNRWQLTSNVAPIFLGSVSNGSPIDSTLAKNPKSYNTNVGFGLGVSYVVNKKLTVRTGLNKVNISYDTNDILFFTGLQAKRLRNVSPAASSSMIQVQSNTAANQSSFSESGLLPFENTFVHKNSGYLNQQIGYLEMPVEMSYSLFEKKLGLKIIGGFSSLFLQDNRITIVSDGRETLLGKANNLNDVHFSTNFGLGLKYGFMKSFEFNLEPTVKYQLNTFSSNAGNFKPYIFGVYSGVSYKF